MNEKPYKIIIDKNFVIFNFHSSYSNQHELEDYKDILILNLASRKQFWTRKKLIEQKITARTTDADNFGYDFDNRDYWGVDVWISGPCEMKVGPTKIEIKYNLNFSNQSVDVRLGSLKYRNCALGQKYPKWMQLFK